MHEVQLSLLVREGNTLLLRYSLDTIPKFYLIIIIYLSYNYLLYALNGVFTEIVITIIVIILRCRVLLCD